MSNDLNLEESIIAHKIYVFRGQKVMLSGDLADLYEVSTKVLNQQVKRNITRFPERYMFKLTMDEYREGLRSQNVTLKRGQHSKYPPYAFTEHGVLMLSSILRSERAEKVNLIIIDTFVKLREVVSTHKDILIKLEQIERTVTNHDDDIALLFDYLKKLLTEKDAKKEHQGRKQIGFKKER